MSQGIWATRNSKETSSSLEPPEETQACQHLDFSAMSETHHSSDLQNCKIINLCCFKPLSSWQFVTSAIENEYIFCSLFLTKAFSTMHYPQTDIRPSGVTERSLEQHTDTQLCKCHLLQRFSYRCEEGAVSHRRVSVPPSHAIFTDFSPSVTYLQKQCKVLEPIQIPQPR